MLETRDDELFVLDEPPPRWVSVAALQCQLRSLFVAKPLHRALAQSLEEIGALLEADYVVTHARCGPQPLSEEWCRRDLNLSETLRDQVNRAMIEAGASDMAQCVRLTGEVGDFAVVAAVIYGDNADQVGCAGFVFRDCSRAHAYEVLVQVEALVGFLALLITERSRRIQPLATGLDNAMGDPLRLLLQLVADVSSRYHLEQVAVGVVEEHRVRVALVNGELDLRASNPGVRVLRDAMTECLDLGEPIRLGGSKPSEEFRLHAAWLRHRGCGTVATVPLEVEGSTVAVVAVASAEADGLRDQLLAAIAQEISVYASLLPVSRLATRSLRRHAMDSVDATFARLGSRLQRTALGLALVVATLLWLIFGTMTYRVTVPGTVAPAGVRVVSAPRDGILAELYVRPGDQVHSGQLLAELDSHDDQLALAELEAEAASLQAQVDQALGEHDSGALKVLEAQRRGVLARMQIVARRIEQARVRATGDGIVVSGELREKLGARLAMGDALFEIARFDGARIELRVPERVVIDARRASAASFVAAAAPDVVHDLEGLRLAPASSVHDGKNVFLGEAEASRSLADLPPGLEGFAILEVGPRAAGWVLGHRLLDWLRLNFWL